MALVLLAVPVLLPVVLVISLLILIADGGPVFFAHRRIGQSRRSFQCLKFRTMVRGADQKLSDLLARDPEARLEWSENQKLRNDPRVIGGIGSFLRRTSLDELPQLFNVLKGEMSLVGPRPVEAAELERYGSLSSVYASVRPGLTGPWQISGRSDTSFNERIRLDVAYVRSRSFLGDIVILLRTLPVVTRGHGAY